MSEFRDGIGRVSQKALNIMENYFDGTDVDPDKVKRAEKMLGMGIRVEHMNQTKDYQRRSLALRLIRYLPEDEIFRRNYIEMTNPEVKPLLLTRPKI